MNYKQILFLITLLCVGLTGTLASATDYYSLVSKEAKEGSLRSKLILAHMHLNRKIHGWKCQRIRVIKWDGVYANKLLWEVLKASKDDVKKYPGSRVNAWHKSITMINDYNEEAQRDRFKWYQEIIKEYPDDKYLTDVLAYSYQYGLGAYKDEQQALRMYKNRGRYSLII